MEQARRSALKDHVHRIAPMGARVLISGTWYNRESQIERITLVKESLRPYFGSGATKQTVR